MAKWEERLNKRTAPWLFLSPYLVLTLIFFIYPFIYAIILAFYQTNGPKSWNFVGLENFVFVLADGDFHIAVWNTTVFALASVLVQLPLSLGMALLLNSKKDRLKGVFRLILFSPYLVGQIFVGIIFSIIFMPRYGMFNRFLQEVIGWGLEKRWLENPNLVMPALIIAAMWMYVGFNMIYFLAALQNVDQNLEEAALIDGANPWQLFWAVTFPAIKPVALFVVVMSTIGSYQLFELPYALLQNAAGVAGYGPKDSGLTIVGYLYRTAFEAGDLGTGAAIGWLLAIIIFTISFMQMKIGRGLETE
ncbi:TPA: sugar ABC transporter permease [Candidatus Poribacteria bacterium]|jgi:ABC-type sugar transport system permease subunit|nr:sugar ABC transporter permease [Candidatus Poribacteria bacterium]HIB86969.1 sugar ABC transporter permease [Candidatus Poribacteria bacterium]HIB99143.1 sugar ABC transporter permease [Candidatus Poribacteria bacterium]HIM10832.1 sugar ABC transporter permease [Candidatus Poribacteria bacterium]HIN28996.1 sugar ABC transporter permease [Candidatus Poribacteria bacterium]